MGCLFRSRSGNAQLVRQHLLHAEQPLPAGQHRAPPVSVVGTGYPDVNSILPVTARDARPDDVPMPHIGTEVLLVRPACDGADVPPHGGVEECAPHVVCHRVAQLVPCDAEIALLGTVGEAWSFAFLVGEDMEAEAHIDIDHDPMHAHLDRERIKVREVVSTCACAEYSVRQFLLPSAGSWEMPVSLVVGQHPEA